jgi:hypothetical protein
VDGELIRNLMRTQRNTQLLGLLLIPVYLGVLWRDAPFAALLAWTVFTTIAASARIAVISKYKREVMRAGPEAHRAFFERYRMVWPVSAAMWGLTTLLYFDRAPLADQFICWLALAGLGMFSINSLSSHLPTMRAYLNTLGFTALAVMAWRIGVELRLPLLDGGVAAHPVADAVAGRIAAARHAPAQLRAAVPQQPADRVADAPDAGGAGRG